MSNKFDFLMQVKHGIHDKAVIMFTPQTDEVGFVEHNNDFLDNFEDATFILSKRVASNVPLYAYVSDATYMARLKFPNKIVPNHVVWKVIPWLAQPVVFPAPNDMVAKRNFVFVQEYMAKKIRK